MKAFHRLHALRLANDAKRAHMDTIAPRFSALRTRHENGTAPRAVSAFQLFQTPEAIAGRMVEMADPEPGLSWLEPSAGLGRILRPILETLPSSVHAVEIDKTLSGELFGSFPDVTLSQRDFLTMEPPREGAAGLIVKSTPLPFYDRIVMNPPFHMRADIRHTLHALKFLRAGGTLVGLCMATRHREEAIRPLADVWEAIPEGAFRSEGTGVGTYLFRIRT